MLLHEYCEELIAVLVVRSAHNGYTLNVIDAKN